MNSRDGIFGPGNRANACLGRAVRLCFMNGFEARPGILDRGTLGNPSKYTLTFAENEEESPWEPLHVSRGFQPGDSCVTIAVAYNPITVNNAYGQTGEMILASVADTLKSACLAWRFPAQWALVFGPEHAITLNEGGWTRRGIQEYLMRTPPAPRPSLSAWESPKARSATATTNCCAAVPANLTTSSSSWAAAPADETAPS